MGKRKKPGEIEADLCDVLSRGPVFSHRSFKKLPFPYDLRVVRPNDEGAPIILKVEDNTARIVGAEYVAGYLREYVANLPKGLADYNITYKQCAAVIESWVYQRRDLNELPKPVAFKSDGDLALARMPFDPVPCGEGELAHCAPRFSQMLGRVTSNRLAFCMRIGSLYDPKADRKQAVWMHGPSDAGKSQFIWLLEVLSGGSYGVLGKENLEKSYWKAQLVGKRVALAHEAPAKFLRSDGFKALTGDAQHSIDQKYKAIFVARLDTIVFLFSNEAPEIPHDDALMNRVIDCRIDAVPKDIRIPEPELRAALLAEMPYIAGYCRALYSAISPGSRIPCEHDALTETVGEYEADYLDLIEGELILDPGPDAFLLRSRLRELVEARFGRDPTHQHICKRILKNRFLCSEGKRTFETNEAGTTKRLYVYKGIRERTEKERQFTENEAPSSTENNVVPLPRGAPGRKDTPGGSRGPSRYPTN